VGAQALTFNQNNQITNPGFIYDAAGNLMMDNLNCYSYDAENRLVSTVPETSPGTGVCGAAANGTDYLYDPDGRRVAKIQNGAIAKQFYYDAAGQEIAETSASGTLNRAEIFAGSRHLATWSNNATYFNHADWLGTERVRTTASGSTHETCTSLPFGDGMNCAGPDPSPNHFTGLQRDAESGLDHTLNRQYPSNLGRWLTPDPAGKKAVKLADPQTWNMFAYVRNNPTTLTDPTGLYNTNCASKDIKNCSADIQNFEANRLKDLQSKDPRVRAAAAAYGSFNDKNNVNVGFDRSLKVGGTAAQDIDSKGRPLGSITVTFQSMENKKNTAGLVDVAHEGSHVEDFNTVMAGGKKTTNFATEMKAYQTAAAVLNDVYAVGRSASIGLDDNHSLFQPVVPFVEMMNSSTIQDFLAVSPFYGFTPQNPGGYPYVLP